MDNSSDNRRPLAAFERYIAECGPVLKQRYDQRLAGDLSRQQWLDCFQRNVVAVMAEFYDDAFAQLRLLTFDARRCQVKQGMVDLTGQVLAIFDGFSDELLSYAVEKHRTSCALSNFPDEHKPDKAYVNDVKRDIGELWRNFALTINHHFLQQR